MNKLAQVVVEDSKKESMNDSRGDSQKLYLQKRKEEEIRMKLDEFARELSQVKAQRDKH
jgi:hypothetical protein